MEQTSDNELTAPKPSPALIGSKKTLADCLLMFSAPQLWNNLPSDIRAVAGAPEGIRDGGGSPIKRHERRTYEKFLDFEWRFEDQSSNVESTCEEPPKVKISKAQPLAGRLKRDIPDEYIKDCTALSKKRKFSFGNICVEFYKMQSKHALGKEEERVVVPILISTSTGNPKVSSSIPLKPVHPDWLPHLANAIKDINDAAPGLNLYETSDWDKAKIVIYGVEKEGVCDTRGNIDPHAVQKVRIRLADNWSLRKRTSCHELLHALFVKHEQDRTDGDNYVDYQGDGYQVKSRDDTVGITRFDPFSIMIYPEGDSTYTRKAGADEVWKLKTLKEPNVEMSELDKVGLNIAFRPCKGPNYSPNKQRNGLWYCARQGATEKHNWPAEKATDGKCGPNNGPNCPACRVLANPFIAKFCNEGRWQGWSGIVYCGVYFGVQERGHDGYCGPDNGPACPSCRKYMFPHYNHGNNICRLL